MGGKVLLADGEAARTAGCRVLVRGGTDEETGEALSAGVVAERAGWCASLVRGMAARLLAEHWNAADVTALASGRDEAGRPLPAAWTAVRRLGWAVTVPDGVTVNDRIARMAQDQAGRLLRSACWRAALTDAVLATWPEQPGKRTAGEWDAVRGAVAGGEHVPSAVIRARTRQLQRFLGTRGRLPGSLFELEAPPGAAGVLLLPACDRQQATIERSAASVRKDTPQRPACCPAQPAGTRARTRPAALPPAARTGHAGQHSAPDSTSTPTPPRHATPGTRSLNPQVHPGSLS